MKEGQIETVTQDAKVDLEQINAFSRKRLGENEVYTFSVVLCDNEIDRDTEKFSLSALQTLATLYVGKTGIFDHSMRGKDQKARIYCAQVEAVSGKVNRVGEAYHRLTAKAYMLRTQENEGLIAEIDAGIKKEVSVGVSMGSTTCSICGNELRTGSCKHVAGKQYGGKLCYKLLDNAKDAYEWSFVAVPAQPLAGVIKSFKQGKVEQTGMKELIETLKAVKQDMTVTKTQADALLGYVEELEEEARIGKHYKDSLRTDVMKLLPMGMPELDGDTFGRVAQIMTVQELQGFKKAFEARKSAMVPSVPQLAVKQEDIKTDYTQFKI